jgi:hypothetical protein
MTRTNRENAKAAMNAQTNLSMFGAVQALMENSLLIGPSDQRGDASSARIIAICRAEMRHQLIRMDKAEAAIVNVKKVGRA